jgi:O-antigen/teichoic acid export membrane protein
MLRRKVSSATQLSWWRPAATYLGVILPSMLALAVLLSADVLLVKHFFSERAAGQYAAVAALGRVIFWGGSGIALVLFPKVIYRRTQGQSGSHLVVGSLVLVALGGLFGFAVFSFAARWFLTAFAGAAYAGGAGYLPFYAVGMSLLAGIAVFVATHQSHGRPGFLAILVPTTVLEPALIVAFHQSLPQVVEMVDVSMTLVLTGLAAWYLVQNRAARATHPARSTLQQ